MKNFRVFAAMAWLAIALSHGVAQAAPASPYPQTVQQPDGTTLQVFMKGDEFQGAAETADGYTVVRNPIAGSLDFAVRSTSGDLVSSGYLASPANRDLLLSRSAMPPKHLRPPRNVALQTYKQQQLDAIRASRLAAGLQMTGPTGTWAPRPVSGPKKLLVILVSFADAPISTGAASYWNDAVFNGSTASVEKYWSDNSYGAISVAPVTHTQPGNPSGIVSVTLSTNHPNSGNNFNYSTETAWINAALAAAAPYVNFAALDTNGNGTITVDEALVYFVLAGYETSAGSNLTPSIWAHAWGGSGVSVSGKAINHWALNGERYSAATLMKMGVIAHEMGHAMGGLPDLYDINGKNEGLGIFSLMAGGSWGARSGEIGGATPVGLDAWSRQYLGWSTPQRPAGGGTGSLVSPFASASSAWMLMNDGVSTSEYWLAENRPPTSWDAGMQRSLGTWSGGVLIQHLDLNIGSQASNDFNAYVAGSHQGNVAEEPSTATCSMLSLTGATRGCTTILYYAGNSTAFTPTSTPASTYWSGAASNFGISGVSAPGTSMTATFSVPGATATYSLSVTRAGTGSGSVTSTPAGISCGATCSASFNAATAVTLAATPAAGSTFAGWSGACAGTGSCALTMDAAKSVTATFNPAVTLFALSVTKSGSGSVTSSPAGIDCGAICSASFASGSSVTLTATPAAGFAFAGWSGACTGTGACTVTMASAQRVSASFTAIKYALTVAKSGTGTGSVASSPRGISCGATCTASFAAGTNVTLTARAARGSTFAGWSGACSGTSTCVVSMLGAQSVTASFVPVQYTLTVSRSGVGSGSVASTPAGIDCGAACSAAFDAKTSVMLVATPAPGSVFTGWSGACRGTGGCVVTMGSAKNVTAGFGLPKFTLSVSRAGNGSGTITSVPTGISCGSKCSAAFAAGTSVTLTAKAASGSVFAGWSGACTGSAPTCTTVVSGPASAGATFNRP